MQYCKICGVPDSEEICDPCKEMEKRVDSLISCEPEKALAYLKGKVDGLKQKLILQSEVPTYAALRC